jgi:competence protein ComEA
VPRSLRWIAAVVAVAAVSGSLALWLLPQPRRSPLHILIVETPPAPVDRVAQIAGAVRNPGVYPLAPGARLAELVDAAGGFADDADTARVNLARRIADGERIDVPRLGAAPAGVKVAINRASSAELLTLPGVTVQQASFIRASIRRDGPLRSAQALVERRLASADQAKELDQLVDWAP